VVVDWLRCVVPTGKKIVLSTVARLTCTAATALHHHRSQTDPLPSSLRPQQQTIPTSSLKGTFILFSCYGYSVIGSCPCSIVFTGPSVERPFSHGALHQIVVYSRFTFRPTLRPPKNYSVRTSTSLMTPRTTSVSSSVPLSSLGRCACGGWGVSR
jgi:hypothetical protein